MIDIIPCREMENPYPQQPDDGTWEGEGGYVAKPNHVVYKMLMPIGGWFSRTVTSKEVILAHPLTVAEISHALG